MEALINSMCLILLSDFLCKKEKNRRHTGGIPRFFDAFAQTI